METVKITINGIEVTTAKNATILEASFGLPEVSIPTLYYYKGIVDKDESGLCTVKMDGKEGFVNASCTMVEEGMHVVTHSPELDQMRKEALKKICLIYDPSGDALKKEKSEFTTLLEAYGLTDGPFLPEAKKKPIDTTSNEVFDRNPNKCIRCGRCARTCGKVQRIGAISISGSGLEAEIKPNTDTFSVAMGAGTANCSNCGQCVAVCPTGALTEKNHIVPVMAAIEDPKKYVIVQAAPSVRVGLGDAFGYPIGTDVEGKLAAALRRLGFDSVLDTVLGADLTIMEEANELIHRVKEGGVLPMITSCCPGWVKYCEKTYGDLRKHLSSCKSPHMMLGALLKSYYAEKKHLQPEDVVVVSVMPCTAKKFEITRNSKDAKAIPDVDYVLTTRELAEWIQQKEIDFASLPNESFDTPLDMNTGAGVIFGATGGVMEAALRTAVEALTGKTLERLEFNDVRGVQGMKEASYELNGKTMKVAVVSGLGNTQDMLDRIQGFKADYQFIEIMACPGGCVNGGGQPRTTGRQAAEVDIRAQRAAGLYKNDEHKKLRKSHENPALLEIYDQFLGEPGSQRAHELLHTSYVAR